MVAITTRLHTTQTCKKTLSSQQSNCFWDRFSVASWFSGLAKYLLTCIDVLSKFAWVVPLKTKTGKEIVAAFKEIFRRGRKPEKLQTDAGTEFKNRAFQTFLKEENVHFFVTYNETKAQVAERFNRTLRQLMWTMFTTTSSYQYLDKLGWFGQQKLQSEYTPKHQNETGRCQRV